MTSRFREGVKGPSNEKRDNVGKGCQKLFDRLLDAIPEEQLIQIYNFLHNPNQDYSKRKTGRT